MALTIPSAPATLSAVFKEIVSKEMERQGFNLLQLAQRADVPYPRLYVWLRGAKGKTKTDGGKERGITSDNLEKVLKALGITLTARPARRRPRPS